MKYFKRAGIYKASNVTFDPNTLEARSYVWRSFVRKIEGKVIFNDFYYSPSTRKHQGKVRRLLDQLGIKVDITLALPKGLQIYSTLDEVYLAAEEHLCDAFLEQELKKQERNLKAKVRRQTKKLEDYLENQVHFRDYEIKEARQFGHLSIVGVHQVVDMDTLERDVEEALYNFHRDGFGKIVFYVGA